MSETAMMKPTREIAAKLVKTVDAGLCGGLGSREPGKMCVEAAVCFAFGLPHGDSPPCVGSAVRRFKIALNDLDWSSYAARAKGMRRLAVAQLGSDALDQQAFGELLALKVIQKLCPNLFGELAPQMKSDKDREAMIKAAKEMAAVTDLKTGLKILTAALAHALALDLALALAHALARARARARARAGDLALALARARARARDRAYDGAFTLLADIGLECLVEMKSPGCEWLELCD